MRTRGDNRRRTPSEEIRESLVGAAFHLLEAEGPEALSVRRVAAQAGVAPMGVYNHFEGKNGVIDAIFQAGFATLVDELADIPTIADPVEAFREGLRRYRRLAVEHPRTYAVMFLKSVPAFEPSEASMAVASSSFDALTAAIARAMASGAFAEGDPPSVAQVTWAAVHGAVALEIAGYRMVDDMAVTFEQLLDTLGRGLAAPG